MTAPHPRSRGFSRAELVMALSLLGLGALAVTIIARPSLAKNADAPDDPVATLVSAVSDWQHDNSSGCPTVGSLISDGYLSSDVSRQDRWGGSYRIACQGDKLFVHSDGPDLKPLTLDDINTQVD